MILYEYKSVDKEIIVLIKRIKFCVVIVCSIITCVGCGSRKILSRDTEAYTGKESVLDNNEESVTLRSSEDTSIVGKYYNPEDGLLSITDNSDGTYGVELSIYRLTTQDDGVGQFIDGEFIFTATDASGNPMKWKAVKDDNSIKISVVESTWEYLPVGKSFGYSKK